MWGDSFSTVGGYLQYCGGCSVQWGITSVQWGITSVQWGIPSYCGGYSVHWRDNISACGGITSVQWGDNISTVEGIQYSGGRILISASLVIKNDEKISTFSVLQYEIFIRKFFENSSRFHAC